MPGLDWNNASNKSDHHDPSSSPQPASGGVVYPRIRRNADSAPSSSARYEPNSVHVATSAKVNSNSGVRKFTSKELSQLNQRHNAHVAYRGKVSGKGVNLVIISIVMLLYIIIMSRCYVVAKLIILF